MKLNNFFYDCDKCNEPLRFDYTEQERICYKCNSVIKLSKSFQEYLINERKLLIEEVKNAYELEK
jgi:hypothetical protein